ncbi:unnamed protein product, partial [Ectocarpus fasciculatus]
APQDLGLRLGGHALPPAGEAAVAPPRARRVVVHHATARAALLVAGAVARIRGRRGGDSAAATPRTPRSPPRGGGGGGRARRVRGMKRVGQGRPRVRVRQVTPLLALVPPRQSVFAEGPRSDGGPRRPQGGLALSPRPGRGSRYVPPMSVASRRPPVWPLVVVAVSPALAA